MIKTILKKLTRGLTREINATQIDYATLQNMIRNESNTILLDVRSIQEFNEGHLLGALNLPLGELKNKVSLLIPNHGQTIIVYCQMGGRSKKATNILNKMGYTNVYNLEGGLDSI